MNEREKRTPCDCDSENTDRPGGRKKLPEERTAGPNLKNQSGLMGVLIPKAAGWRLELGTRKSGMCVPVGPVRRQG